MIKNEVARAALTVAQQWAIDELQAAQDRATKLRCGGSAYNDAINSIHYLMDMINRIDYALNVEEPTPVAPVPLGASLIEEGPNPVEPDPEPAPEPEPEKTVVLVDISEVRTKAKEARDAGVKLPEVWKAFGGTKLSDVPAAKYNELMDLLDSKMKEIGG